MLFRSPVFWPGEFHGLYSPWGCKESDRPEQLSLSPILEETRVNMKIREWGPMRNSIFSVCLWVVLFCGNHAKEILWEDVYFESISRVTGNLHFFSHFKTKSTYLFCGGKEGRLVRHPVATGDLSAPGAAASFPGFLVVSVETSPLCLRCCGLFILINLPVPTTRSSQLL